MTIWEVHLTIDTKLDDVALALACADVGVDLVRIALPSGKHPLQRMATRDVDGTLDDARAAARESAHALAACRCSLTRTKIECDLAVTPKRVAALYLEHHVLIAAPPSLVEVGAVCARHRARLSSSSKAARGDRYATVRHGPLTRVMTSQHSLHAFARDLERHGATVARTISERVVVDTNVGLDAGWEAPS